MRTLTTLGSARSMTTGAAYHSTLLDTPAERINDGGLRYCTAPADVADGIHTLCAPHTPGCYPAQIPK